jgi:hypothetical protein
MGIALAGGTSIPLKMTLTSARNIFDELDSVATSSILSYERYHTRGLRQSTRDESLAHMCRRAGVVVTDEGQQTNLVRFTHSMAGAPRELLPKARISDTWAWEVSREAEETGDGRHRYTVTVTGLGRVGNALAYGPELVGYLAALHAAAATMDPDVEVETISYPI